jgi:hypothetical protein
MKSQEINSGLCMRLITLFLYKLNKVSCLRRLRKHPGRILLVSSKLCIKATAFTTLAEANGMLFVAQNTSIPVPKVYSSFKHKDRMYILVERIAGEDLSQGWTQRSQESKARILAQLKTMTTELRSLTPHDGIGVANVDSPSSINVFPTNPPGALSQQYKTSTESCARGLNSETTKKPVQVYGNLSNFTMSHGLDQFSPMATLAVLTSWR